MNNKDILENDMADEVKAGLIKGDFEVYYQPVFSMAEGRPIYAEALLRWNRKKNKKLPAAEFIHAVEKSGFQKDIDLYVIEKVCRQMKTWKNDGCPLLPVSVNISKAGIFDIDLCEEMVLLTEKYHIDHSLINIEINGTEYDYDPELLQKKIKALKNAGFSVIIDDFGNGSSSLKMLKDIPFDILKIDRELFDEFETDEKVAGILTSVMRMARWLSISVITEGVESENQRQFLKNMGCNMMQGYYFLRPVPADKFMEYVKKNKKKTAKGAGAGALTFDAGDILDNDVMMNMIYHKFMEGVGIYELIGDKLKIIRVNEGYCRMFGYDPKAMPEVADNVYLMAHEDYRGILMEECQKIAREKCERQFEFRRKTGYGKYLWVWAGGTYIGMKNDHPVICFLLRDITRYVESQKQAEIKVAKQRELYMKLMEDTNVGIFEIETEKDELTVYMKMPDGQRKDFTIKGIVSEQGDLTGDNIIMKKIFPGNENIYKEVINAAEKGQQNGEIEYKADYYGDGYKWYKSYYETVLDQEKGKVTNIIGRTVSIEKEKEIENRLKQEKAYRAVLFKEMLVVYEMDITLDISVPMYRNQKRAGEYYPFNYYTDFEKKQRLYP
jgi:PAS domain S-box-containing protein